ncbi:MAG TPA: division/cell wall cluster transcriptional repressor MraZ [Gaiella sp.]|jgi:transcriptional regulator MraZ|nr:division/cell wall cluster transcriptional repressor MraZ [Gaiella sp.]
MFIGTYEHTIDDKSRLTLPARFREALGDGVILARGIDGNAAVYPRETWKVTVEERMSALDPLSTEARQLRRFFFTGAGEADIDGSGRVHVPSWLVKHAGLEREVVVAGNYDHLELWNPTTWEKHLTAVEGSVEHAAERLAAHGS